MLLPMPEPVDHDENYLFSRDPHVMRGSRG
jgi:hypothetical protein